MKLILMIVTLLTLSGCAFHQALIDMDAQRTHVVSDGRGGYYVYPPTGENR